MNLREEAGMLAEQAIEAARRGRTQAAVDYWRQARKLFDADNAAWETMCHDLEGEVEALQVELVSVREEARIRNLRHDQRETWGNR